MIRSCFRVLILLTLAACTTSAPQADSSSPTVTLLTATPSQLSTTSEAPTSTIVPMLTTTSFVVTAATPTSIPPVTYRGALVGRDANGAFTLGDPSAPLTLIDYSDFL